MEYLEIQDGQGRRRQVPLNRSRFLIGREPTCDIHLSHPGVSRRHAQLQRTEQGRWLLQDLKSRNHVYVDDEPIQHIVLEPRKPFHIADYSLTLHEITPPPDMLQGNEDDSTHLKPNEDSWLDRLRYFQRTLLAINDPKYLLERLADEFQEVLHPSMIAVGVSKPEGYSWEVIRASAGSVPLQEANQHLAEDPSSFLTWSASPQSTGRNEPTPCMLFPMKCRNHIVGHILIVGSDKETLPKHLRRYLSLTATQGALTYDNLQLGGVRQSQLAVEKELQQARQIQVGLFPPSFDVDRRLDVFAVNLPSAQVSGDHYDVFPVDDDSLAFVIADAIGHGMPAALMMAAVRAALRMSIKLNLPWQAMFQGLDDLIRQARANAFVTGIVGRINLKTEELFIVSAGHPTPSIVVDGQLQPLPESCRTRPWGVEIDSVWEVGCLPLRGQRWSIIAYTDGITRKSYGSKRIDGYHLRNHKHSAEDLCQGLLSEIAGQSPLEDDQTVLVLCSR